MTWRYSLQTNIEVKAAVPTPTRANPLELGHGPGKLVNWLLTELISQWLELVPRTLAARNSAPHG